MGKIHNFFIKNPILAPTLVGAGGGAAIGYGNARLDHMLDPWQLNQTVDARARKKDIKKGTDEYQKLKDQTIRQQALGGAAMLGLTGGLLGYRIGHLAQATGGWENFNGTSGRSGYSKTRGAGGSRNWEGNGGRRTNSGSYQRSYSRTSGFGAGMGSNSMTELWRKLELTGKETTKKQVKAKYYELAKKHHPDVGGKKDRMREVNDAIDKIKDTDWFHKLAFWEGFKKQAEENSKAPAVAAGVGAAAGTAHALHTHSHMGYGLGYSKNDPIWNLHGDAWAAAHKKRVSQFARKQLTKGIATKAAVGAALGYGVSKLLSKKEAPHTKEATAGKSLNAEFDRVFDALMAKKPALAVEDKPADGWEGPIRDGRMID